MNVTGADLVDLIKENCELKSASKKNFIIIKKFILY